MIRRLLLLTLTVLAVVVPVCETGYCETTCRRVGDTIRCETWCDKSI